MDEIMIKAKSAIEELQKVVKKDNKSAFILIAAASSTKEVTGDVKTYVKVCGLRSILAKAMIASSDCEDLCQIMEDAEFIMNNSTVVTPDEEDK